MRPLINDLGRYTVTDPVPTSYLVRMHCKFTTNFSTSIIFQNTKYNRDNTTTAMPTSIAHRLRWATVKVK